MHAEEAYQFRHNMERDAAYQLFLPGRRAELHGQALDVIEALFADNLEPLSAELAEHARAAAHDVKSAQRRRHLGMREVKYLLLGAMTARMAYQNFEAMALARRAMEHPNAAPRDQLTAAEVALDCAVTAGQWGVAETLAEKMRTLAIAHKDLNRECAALRRTVELLLRSGNVDQARHALDVWRLRARKSGSAAMAGEIHVLNAAHLRMKGRMDEALHEYNSAIALLQQEHDSPTLASALNNKGALLSSQMRFEEAIECYKRSLELLQPTRFSGRAAIVLNNLGRIELLRGQLGKADAAFKNAEQLARTSGDAHALCVCLNSRAQLALFLKEHDTVQALLAAVESISQDMGNLKELATARFHFGLLRRDQGHLESALAFFRDAVALMTEAGEARAAMRYRAVGAGAEFWLDQRASKLVALVNIAEETKSVGDSDLRWTALDELGKALLAAGDHRSAACALLESAAIKRRRGTTKGLVESLCFASVAFAKAGCENDATLALAEARKLAAELPTHHSTCFSLEAAQAQVHLCRGDRELANNSARVALGLPRDSFTKAPDWEWLVGETQALSP